MKQKKRILWDLRLFSTNYASRGVGVYCTSVCQKLLPLLDNYDVYLWCSPEHAPDNLKYAPVHWIEYSISTWKKELFRIPSLILRYRINLFHYWVLLGPLQQCATGLFHPCKTCGTVYDLGVEYWHTPWLENIRKRTSWKVQRYIAESIDSIFTISSSTKEDFTKLYPQKAAATQTVYMPAVIGNTFQRSGSAPFFIFLRGGPHKNEHTVVEAFIKFRHEHQNYSLILLGEDASDTTRMDYFRNNNIICEQSMEHYQHYLITASALLFCSFSEGFGIPPIEAMARGCPLIVSDIAPLRETCNDAALFVDPHSIVSITLAMHEIIKDNLKWSDKSFEGGKRYTCLSSNSCERILKCYEEHLS
jgi:glycosyltransferase involved in cell wall biosynthesis